MNSIDYKFNPGDTVFAVNCYPSGARIFEGTVMKVFITVSSFHNREQSNTKTVKISYKINSIFREFTESEVVQTIEEAQKIKNDWLKKIQDDRTK